MIVLALIGGSSLLYLRLGAPGYGDLALADRIAFVSGGSVLECADTEDLFTRPTDTRTADFLGMPRGTR